jgi:hypothetical protein
MKQNRKTGKTQFNYSEEKWNLWKAEGCKIDGTSTPEAAGTILQMFVLNADSKKAVKAAQVVLAIGKSIPNATKYVLQASKADGTLVELSVTGEELKDAASSIVHLASTRKEFKVLSAGASKKASVRNTSTSRSALIPQAVKAPAKIAANVAVEPAAE